MVTTTDVSAEQQAVERLIAPLPLSEFLRDYWERKLLLLQGRPQDQYRDILSVAQVDDVLASCRIPNTHIDLARDSEPIPKADYCAGSAVDLDRLLAFHRDGATIIMRALHEYCMPLQLLKRASESVFECPAQVNVYLTPPSSQSSPAHFDTHDLFILQIAGSKRWRLYGSPRELPLHDERFDRSRHTVGDLEREITLQAGDVLYLPRGIIHEPSTTMSYSVHISLGIIVTTWTDLLIATVHAASDAHVELRRSPALTDSWIRSPQSVAAQILRLVGFLDGAAARTAAESAAAGFIERRPALSTGRLSAVSNPRPLTVDSRVGRALGAVYRIRVEDSKVHLETRKVAWSLSASAEVALRVIAESNAIRVGDIPGLSEELALDLVSQLLDEGFLVHKDIGER